MNSSSLQKIQPVSNGMVNQFFAQTPAVSGLISRAPRELTEEEVSQVDGGMANVGIGAAAGAIFGGAQFLMSDDRFSWGGFAMGISSGAVGGAIAGMGGFSFAFYGGGLGTLGGAVANRMR